jgi:predicted phage-related endonuclease
MGKDAHEAASRGEIPEHYRLQCQWNLMVSGAERCLFVSYRPEDQTMHEIVVLPDEKEGSELQHAAELWWSNHIVNNIPPPLMDGDYVACDLESWKEAANEYRAALQSAKDAEDRLEVAKTRLHSFVTKDIPALKGSGVMVSTVHRKGNIDYEKVPEIKGVDLEQYRKKPSTYITIKTY